MTMDVDGDLRPVDVLRRHGRTFWLASLVLPPAIRRDLTTLYAFCRLVDDTADLAERPADALVALDGVSADLRRRRSSHPLVKAFLELCERRGVPVTLAEQLIEGVRSDLGVVCVETEPELIRYCYHVASTVGLMICHVLGVSRSAHRFAIDLGIGMQLTNIARDVAEDAGQGRIYLPGTWVRPDTLHAGLEAPAGAAGATLADAVRRALDLAEQYYRSSDQGMRMLPFAARPGLLTASRNYEAIGAVIRADVAGSLQRRARTSGTRKLRGTIAATASAVSLELRSTTGLRHDRSLHASIEPLVAPALD